MDTIAEFLEVFQAVSDSTRLRIVALLLGARKELCVCELVDALEKPQYNVSRSLKKLQRLGLISERRDGKWVYYRLPRAEDKFRQCLMKTIAAIPQKILSNDQRELSRRLKLREGGKCLKGVQKMHLLSRQV